MTSSLDMIVRLCIHCQTNIVPSLIAIHPSFDKLLTSLRTATANVYKLDKQESSFNDVLDAFRLS